MEVVPMKETYLGVEEDSSALVQVGGGRLTVRASRAEVLEGVVRFGQLGNRLVLKYAGRHLCAKVLNQVEPESSSKQRCAAQCAWRAGSPSRRATLRASLP